MSKERKQPAAGQEAQGAGGIEEIRRVRKEKAQKLAELGWPSFPNGLEVTHSVAELRAHAAEATNEVKPDQPRYAIAGRLMRVPGGGKLVWNHLQDRTGRIQLMFKLDVLGEDTMQKVKLLDRGDFLAVSGPLFVTRTGELTVVVEKAQLATKSLHPIPDEYFGLENIELRYRQRYVDLLITPAARDTFEKRSKLVRYIRNFLDTRGFMEVETPMLHPLIGGAAAKPFITHHNALDMDLYLRIAPELYLKRLVVGGFERVYEINRNFRNEGLSTQHNPEFTMLEFYYAYATYHTLMDLTEEMFRGAALDVAGTVEVPYGGWEGSGIAPVTIDFGKPFRRIKVREGVLEKIPGLDLTDAGAILSAARDRGIALDAKAPAGKLVMDLFEHLWEQELVQPTFVLDFPIEVSPLARRKDSDPSLADRFELYVAGRELANAFSELNDPDDQRARFRAQVEAKARGAEETMDYDEDYCHALEIGMPPAAGEGVGIDRLCMILTNAASIRDVILFPQLRRL